MACSNLNPVMSPAYPSVGYINAGVKRPPVISVTKGAPPLPIQVNMRENQSLQPQNLIALSRRNTILYMTAEVMSGFALLSPEPAEARMERRENRRKAMEKLEKLREKAKKEDEKKEKRQSPPPTNPLEQSIGPLVEASFV